MRLPSSLLASSLVAVLLVTACSRSNPDATPPASTNATTAAPPAATNTDTAAVTSSTDTSQPAAPKPIDPELVLGADPTKTTLKDITDKKIPAPDFHLKDVAGKDVSLSDFKGKVVLLDFWATFCPPCLMEMPYFMALQHKLGSQGLQVVGISVDPDGSSVLPGFVKRNKVDYPILVGTEDVASLYGGVQLIPTTFLIDRQGNIRTLFEGPPSSPADFKDRIEKLLKE